VPDTGILTALYIAFLAILQAVIPNPNIDR
jgi:hypothetical protein